MVEGEGPKGVLFEVASEVYVYGRGGEPPQVRRLNMTQELPTYIQEYSIFISTLIIVLSKLSDSLANCQI